MKIALIGYGKMGKEIESIALEKGHTIVLKISSGNKDELTAENLQHADIAMEFSSPVAVVKNLFACFDAGVPVVCGSTGWGDREEEVKNYCRQKRGALLFASNFSIGVNIFFEVNRKLAALMNNRKEYTATIEEIHHTQKKDAPSGTAISLAKKIIEESANLTNWVSTLPSENEILIKSRREDPAPGTHIISYDSAIDTISIIHTAHTRRGFAQGAVTAAEFLCNKTGVYGMKDVLSL